MEIGCGWERLVADMKLALSEVFDGVSYEDRMIVAPNIGATLVLEVLKEWPDLTKRLVLITPPPNQPTMLRLARSFAKARALLNPADKPDELTMHQLYSFFGARLSDRKRLIDVISSDTSITDALLEDPYAWPTPTTGYFYEMFRGVEAAWSWPKGTKVSSETELLILYGGDDPMTANGKFVAPMRRQLEKIGFSHIDTYCVEGGRSGLLIEEARFGISNIIDRWTRGEGAGPNRQISESDDSDVANLSSGVLSKLGLDTFDRDLSSEELVELCYNAIDDESRWVEILYRVSYAISANDQLDEQSLETILGSLMPHWDRSFDLNRQVMQAAAVGAVLENVIDRFQIGMAVVSPDMAVSYANRVFIDDMAGLLGQTFRHGDFKGLSNALRDCVEADFTARCNRSNGEALFMLEGEAVGFHFRPQALRQTALVRGGASGVLILRKTGNDHSRADDEKIEMLQFAYGVTAREAETALCLLDGLSPGEIAERCGVSINTIRTHLKRIYDKIGVTGQTELVARLLKGPIGLIANN